MAISGLSGLSGLSGVALGQPNAAFTGTPLTGEDPLSVTFTNTSTGVITSYLWQKKSGGAYANFSGTPTAQNPTESFAAGSWDVKLTVTGPGGSDPEEKLAYISVGGA